MKQLSIAIVMTVAILLSGCAHDTNEINPQVSPTEATDKSPAPSSTISDEITTETPSPAPSQSPMPSPAILEKLTAEGLKQYLDMKMSEIIETFGEKINGTEAIMESHMVFPCIFIEGLGLTFIFPSDFEDLKPLYIEVDSNNVSIKGARPGMTFSEIMDKLGGQVSETWISNEECMYYQIVYKADGLVYHLVSYDEKGTYTWSYVSLDQ